MCLLWWHSSLRRRSQARSKRRRRHTPTSTHTQNRVSKLFNHFVIIWQRSCRQLSAVSFLNNQSHVVSGTSSFDGQTADLMPAGVRLLVITTRVLLGMIAMDPVNGYSHVARAHPPVCSQAQHSSRRSARPNLRVATRYSIRVCALGPVSSRKGEKDEGADTYTALVSWLIAGGGFVHEAVTLTPNDGTGGRGLVAARDIGRETDSRSREGPILLFMEGQGPVLAMH